MIPENHPGLLFDFCPRCGEKTMKFDGLKKTDCEQCGFQFWFNASGAVAALIFNANKELLLTIRKSDPGKGEFDLPGGFIDPDESAEEALVREIKEELNLNITHFRYLQSFPNQYLYKGVVYHTIDMIFFCTADDNSNITPADDVTGYRWMKPSDIDPQSMGLNSMKKVIKWINTELAKEDQNIL